MATSTAPPAVGCCRVNAWIYGPGPMGGNNWQPTSYNPDTQMFYVCSAVQYLGVQSGDNPFKEVTSYAGIGAIAGAGWSEATGTFTAIDATTGEVAWQKTWPEACYSSTSTTAGNLVFVGKNSGELEAYNAETGDLLWSFQTGAGANNTPTIFEHKGKEYLAFLAAGNSLMATKHGDSLWLFGLDGELGPAASAAGAGQGTEHAGEGDQSTDTTAGDQSTDTTSAPADAAAGASVFADNCAGCHGVDGTGGNGGPDLTAIPAAKVTADVVSQVTKGGGGMPAFQDTLTAQQIQDVSAYVTGTITK